MKDYVDVRKDRFIAKAYCSSEVSTTCMAGGPHDSIERFTYLVYTFFHLHCIQLCTNNYKNHECSGSWR